MNASEGNGSALALGQPGRFTRVSVETRAGQIEARLSEYGNWDLRVRRRDDDTWKLACTGDLDCGAVTSEPVIPIEDTVVRGPLTIDPAARRVTVGGEKVGLSGKEYALLLALASKPERVFAKSELLKAVWGITDAGKLTTRTLDSHASRLRRKLGNAGAAGMVVNTWGVGYRLWDRSDPGTFPSLTAAEPVAA